MLLMFVYMMQLKNTLPASCKATLITEVLLICMVSLVMVGERALSFEMFPTLCAGSGRIEVPLSPLPARLPCVIKTEMFEHHMSGFVNLAANLTCPGFNVIQVKLLRVI